MGKRKVLRQWLRGLASAFDFGIGDSVRRQKNRIDDYRALMGDGARIMGDFSVAVNKVRKDRARSPR